MKAVDAGPGADTHLIRRAVDLFVRGLSSGP